MRETPSGLLVTEERPNRTPHAPDPPPPPAFAARHVDITDDRQRRMATAGSNDWQTEAWTYFDEVEEVKFAAGFRGALMSRLTLYPGLVVDPGQAPVPVVDADPADLPPEIAAQAVEELNRLGTSDQQSALIGHWGSISTVSAEAYLIGQIAELADSGERWRLFSESNMVRDTAGNGTAIRVRPGLPPEQLGPDDTRIRIWRPHARWPDLADSNMRSVLATAEELLIFARQMRAIGKGRNSAGILYIANEIGDTPDGTGKPTLMEQRLMTSMVTAITEDGAPAAAVPHIIRGPAAFGLGQRQIPAKDALFHLALDRSIDDKALERIDFLVKRLAHGLDVPVEVLTGIADINHWGAWQIEDSTYRAHIQPDATVFANAVTTELLRPGLLDALGPTALPWIRRLLVGINPSALVVRPNRAKDALDAFDRWAISWGSLRNHLNFSDDEAPGDDEFLTRLTLTRSIGAATLTAPMLEETGILPDAIDGMGRVTEATAPPAPGQAGDTPAPAAGDQPIPDDTQPDATAAARARLRAIAGTMAPARWPDGPTRLIDPAAPKAQPERTALSVRTERAAGLGDRLASIDRSLTDRLVVAASDAMTNALRVIGNRLRSAAQGNPEALAAINGVAPEQVASTLVAAGFPLPDLEPIAAQQFDGLRERFDTWTAAAFTATAATVAASVPDDEPDTAEAATSTVADGQQARTDSGWQILAGALVALAVTRSLNPSAPPGDGEHDTMASVPHGIVRNSLATVGGVANPGAQPHGFAGEIGPGSTVGQIATGPQTARALRVAGYGISAWQWHHGLPTVSLPGHAALAGVTFTDWDDDQLTNAGAWPPWSTFFPGDHVGCTCSTTPVLAPITEG